jgi:RNA polymerase sigma factor for flagellar operon FliA
LNDIEDNDVQEQDAASRSNETPGAEEERELWALFIAGSEDSRIKLVLMHLPWVRATAVSIFKTVDSRYLDLRDLAQVGLMAMLESMARFDPALSSFKAFAVKRIRGAMLSALASNSELHAQQAFRQRLRSERLTSLMKTAREEHTNDAFAQMVELTLGLAIGHMLEGTALFASDESEQKVAPPYGRNGFSALLDSLTGSVERLRDPDRRIVVLHYFEGRPFNEIAATLKMSRSRVAQIHARALIHLRQVQSRKGKLIKEV